MARDINLDDYEPVDQRISRFRGDYPDFTVATEFERHPLDDTGRVNLWVCRALLWRSRPSTPEDMKFPDATDIASEIDGQGMTQKTSAIETCETSAIGRALANLGYSGNRRVTREEMAKVKGAEIRERIAAATSVQDLHSIWNEVKQMGAGGYFRDAIAARSKKLEAVSE